MIPPAPAFYLVVEMVAGALSPAPFPAPAIGPMDEDQCRTLAGAIEAEEVPVIASVTCRRAVRLQLCSVPGRPWQGTACPVFEPIPSEPPPD